MKGKKPATVDEYLATMPAATRSKLEDLRRTIRAAAPDATEKIGYGIPTYVFHGNLVHFARPREPGLLGLRVHDDLGHARELGTDVLLDLTRAGVRVRERDV